MLLPRVRQACRSRVLGIRSVGHSGQQQLRMQYVTVGTAYLSGHFLPVWLCSQVSPPRSRGDDNGRLVEPSQLYALTSEALYFLPLNLLHRALPAGSDTIASPTAPPGSSAQTGRGPTRKSPTPRPGVNGRYRYLWLALRTPPCGIFVSRICRPKTPTPRPGSGSVPRREAPERSQGEWRAQRATVKQRKSKWAATPSSGGAGMGSARLASVKPATRKTPRATPRRERPPSAGMASPQPMPIS